MNSKGFTEVFIFRNRVTNFFFSLNKRYINLNKT